MLADVIRGNTTTERIEFVLETCCNCSIPFFMPLYLKKQLLEQREKGSFYCPNGHSQHYVGKTEAQKLKEELEREKVNNAEAQEALLNETLKQISLRKKAERQLKAVHRGQCPCCKRTFQNLKRHMETKHPDLIPEKGKLI